jgi:hypothetical protein
MTMTRPPDYVFVDRQKWNHSISATLLSHVAMAYYNHGEGAGSLNDKAEMLGYMGRNR